jgi:hypothetical protein
VRNESTAVGCANGSYSELRKVEVRNLRECGVLSSFAARSRFNRFLMPEATKQPPGDWDIDSSMSFTYVYNAHG